MAEGDDVFTLIRKCFRDLRPIHRRLAQLERQIEAEGFGARPLALHEASALLATLVAFKTQLAAAARQLGREEDL